MRVPSLRAAGPPTAAGRVWPADAAGGWARATPARRPPRRRPSTPAGRSGGSQTRSCGRRRLGWGRRRCGGDPRGWGGGRGGWTPRKWRSVRRGGEVAASVIQRAKRRDRPRARQPGVDAKGSWRWARRPTAAGGGKCWKRTDSLSAPSAASCWRGGHRGLVNCGTVPWRTVVLTHPGHRRPRAPGRAPPRAAASLALSPSPLPPPLPLPPPPSGRSFAPSLPPSRSCRYDCLRACHRWLAASPQRPASRRPAYPPPDGVP